MKMQRKYIPMPHLHKKISVFGLDPGTKNIGFGVVEIKGGEHFCRGYGRLKTDSEKEESFVAIEQETKKLFKKFSATHLAIERIFFGRNVRSAMKVSETRGVILALAQKMGLKIIEIGPQEVKYHISGYGLADKKSVGRLTKLHLGLPQAISIVPDATDALALALVASMKIKAGVLLAAAKKGGVARKGVDNK
jgi:crossover junction endodeoxyribonuclease RuvC